MDKKNTLFGLGFLVLGFLAFFWQARQLEDYERERRLWELQNQPEESQEGDPGNANAGEIEGLTTTLESGVSGEAESGAESLTDLGLVEEPVADVLPLDNTPTSPGAVREIILENAFLRLTLTTLGAGIKQVEFLQTDPAEEIDPFIFNEDGPLPSHAILFEASGGRQAPFLPVFEVTRQNTQSISMRFKTEEGLELVRTYRLPGVEEDRDPYVIQHETLFQNDSQRRIELPQAFIHLGSAGSLAYDRQSVGEYLNVSYFTEGKVRYTKSRQFIGSAGFLGIGQRAANPGFSELNPVQGMTWASVKNQFFVGILKEIPAEEMTSRARSVTARAETLTDPSTSDWRSLGISGNVGFDLGGLNDGESTILGTEFYMGPKEFLRLQSLGAEEERLMQYWGPDIISKAMTVMMYAIHSVVPSWGLAIILLTLVIKLVFWPFTSKGMRAQKLNAVKMQPMQAEMKDLREKYKDNPRQMQTAMAALYKKHDVNPAAMMGGCIPMLVQIPIFIGLYGMLRVAPEFRFADLLWIQSLAYPDAIATISGFTLNLMPLIYGVVMFFQMRMTPMPETADETQQLTMKMMRWMPAFLVIFLYNFAAALFVYFTTNALLTMLQQFLINRKLKPELDALKARIDSGEPPKPPAAEKPKSTKAKPLGLEKKSSDGGDGKKQKAPAKKMMDGLGATRRLKSERGKPSTPSKRKKRR